MTDTPDPSPARRRLAILAQFDPGGGLPAHVRIHLDRLGEVADRRVLVSNSPMSPAALEEAAAVCERVLVRPNIGWDFAGWRDVLSSEDMTPWDSVILTNSSVVGPLYPLAPIVREMEARPCDFWGMVLSKQKRPHLQSYFLAFGRTAVASEAWRAFWAGVEDIADKNEVIRRYEVRLTSELSGAGLDYEAFIPNPRFPASIRMIQIQRLKQFRHLRYPFDVNYVNRTVGLHDELISEGFPYLKASLLWGKDTDRLRSFDAIRTAPGTSYPWSELPL